MCDLAVTSTIIMLNLQATCNNFNVVVKCVSDNCKLEGVTTRSSN